MYLAALRGNQADVTPLVEATLAAAEAGGHGSAVTAAHWAVAILHNGVGRYAEAMAAAEHVTRDADLYVSMWTVPELVEAAVRIGKTEVATGALERLTEMTQAGGTDFGLGIEARCRALVSQGQAAEAWYGEAIERLGHTRLRPDLARAHLLYGEYLCRAGRLPDAREQLRTAHDMLAAIGMEAFAERARLELTATGGKVPKRRSETRDQLTPQEEQIARLARDGLSNPEIGAQVFLSSRTVEWHLRKIFTKLGIGSRRELDAALGQRGQDGQPA
jgi:ATP/maltotriose-dependent transcriptional regulator MalT